MATRRPGRKGEAASSPSLARDTRGAVSTEYVVLVGTVSLVAIAALLVVGPNLVRNFERTRNIIVSPFP